MQDLEFLLFMQMFPRMNSYFKSASQRGEYVIHTSSDNIVKAPARSLVCDFTDVA